MPSKSRDSSRSSSGGSSSSDSRSRSRSRSRSSSARSRGEGRASPQRRRLHSRSRSRSRSPARRSRSPARRSRSPARRSRSPARRSRSPAARRRSPRRSPPPRRRSPPRRSPPPPPPRVASIHRARVVATKPFGAFCELQGERTQGLVHISQLAPRRVEAVEDVVQQGDEVWVKVIGVEGGRVKLSMRALDQADGTERDDEPARGGRECFNCGKEGHQARDCAEPRKERRGGEAEPMPELHSIHRGKVVKMATRKGDDDASAVFGAFVALDGFRKQGLLHVSQISEERIEGGDVESIIPVGHEVYVKVIAIDEEAGKLSLSMKYCSQRNGRDLDPTHMEALADGGGRRGKGGERGSLAAMQVPEYGGKQSAAGGYAMLSDEEDAPPAKAAGSYNLKPLAPGGQASGASVEAMSEQQRLQVELTAGILAKAREKKAKKDKKEKKEKKSKKSGKVKKSKKDKKEHKKDRKHAKEKKSHKHKK
ncbi:hypothetical protein AB1Y20_017274 [Prymnesium parvum]|uniref:S1 motif domain-containing protein n=1 Tax=Prymnesium parvum TaxID=97485 RepID=A0AB34JMS4_PRYPA